MGNKAKTNKYPASQSGSKPPKVSMNPKLLWFIIVASLVIAAIIVVVVVHFVKASQDKIKPIKPTDEEITVIGSCNGFDVYFEELRYVTLLYKQIMMNEYGEDIFDTRESRELYRDELTENVLENITANYAVLSLCREFNININDSEMREAAEEKLCDFIDAVGGYKVYKETLSEQNLTDHYVRFNLGVEVCRRELFIAMTQYTDTIDSSDEAIRKAIEDEYIRTLHVYISNTNGKTKEQNRSTAGMICEKLRSGEATIDEMISQYGSDVITRDGYYFTRGEMIEEYENASFALELNEVSDPVETADGFYVIVRMPKEQSYIDSHFAQIKDSYVNLKFYGIIDQRQKDLEFTFNDYGKTIDLTEMQ